MINHPHYRKRYVHIRAGELKIVSHNRYFVLNHYARHVQLLPLRSSSALTT